MKIPQIKIILLSVTAVLLVGVVITKLTVQDMVSLTDEEKQCMQVGIQQQFDNPFQRVALFLGKSAVVDKQGDGIIKKNTLIVKSYTIFRIPLPDTHFFNRFTQHVICDWATEKITEDSVEFAEKIQNFVIKNVGQPIEGFSAPVYLQAFPGLTKTDFNDVETYEGRYAYIDGKLKFNRKSIGYMSSAEEAITAKGHETLFNNLRARLGSNLSVDEIISKIIVRL